MVILKKWFRIDNGIQQSLTDCVLYNPVLFVSAPNLVSNSATAIDVKAGQP